MFRAKLLACLVVFVAAHNAAQAQDVLKLFPRDSALVLRIESVDELIKKTDVFTKDTSMLAQMLPDIMRSGMSDVIGLGESGLEAVDTASPIYVCLPDARDFMNFAVLLRPRDKQAVLKALLKVPADGTVTTQAHESGFQQAAGADPESVAYFREAGEFILFTRHPGTIARFPSGEFENFADALGDALTEQFEQGDVGLAMNLESIVASYAAVLDVAKASWEQDMRDSLVGVTGGDQLATYSAELIDRLKEVQLLVMHFALQPEGVEADGVVSLQKGSKLEEFVQAVPAGPISSMEKLPAVEQFYFGTQLDSELFGYFSDLTMRLGIEAPSKEDQAEIDGLFKNAGIQSFAIGGSGSAASDAASSNPTPTFLVETNRPEDFLAAIRLSAALQRKVGINQYIGVEGDYTTAAEEYKGVAIDLDHQRSVAKPGFDSLSAEQKAVLQVMIDSPEQVTRAAIIQQFVVMSRGERAEQMHRVIDVVQSDEGQLGATAGFQATRHHLAERSLLFLMDISGARIEQSKAEWAAAGQETPEFLVKLSQERAERGATYFGFSLSSEDEGIRLRMFLPTGQIRELMSNPF